VVAPHGLCLEEVGYPPSNQLAARALATRRSRATGLPREGVSRRSWPLRAAVRRDGPPGGGGADSGAIGDDGNAAERPPADAQQA